MPRVDFELPTRIPPELAELIELAPTPGLGAVPKCQVTFDRVQNLLRKHPRLKGELTEAAVWLLAGELDRSHEVSQGIETPEAAYWHGIMHRREGDFWNAKYWFRKVGKHPVFVQLAEQISQHRSQSTTRDRSGSNPSLDHSPPGNPKPANPSPGNPTPDNSTPDNSTYDDFWRQISADLSDPTKIAAALVDDCEKALASQPSQIIPLQRICWLEWQFLFHYGWD